MTVSYNLDVSSTSLIAFLKLQLRWRGSVWKSVMRELFIFSFFFAVVTSIYRTNYFLSEEQRVFWDNFAALFDQKLDYIPLTFMLGFFVTIIVGRWNDIFLNIGWVDNTALLIATYIRGSDEKSRILRRTALRYMVLTQVIIFRDISMRVRKRFPTLETVVAADFLYLKLPLFQTGLAIVDECYNDSPPLQKDVFWSAETVEPLYSADTANIHMNPQIGSAAAYETRENEIIMRPHVDTNDDFEDGADDVEECNPRRLPRGISVVSVNRNCESRTSLVSRRNPGPTIMERLRSQFGGSKVNRPGKLFGSSQFSINTAIGDNDIGSCASILGELADDANKASQGLLTPEEITGSPRRTPIDVLTSVPEEDEDAQKTRTSVDLRKWKEMVENEKKKEEEEKRRKLSRKEEEKEEDLDGHK
ncbi:hypothetical protein CAEBREN_32081 [Caenorhabditis brenneri]|uniref:Bestrophin homolog n=1 Tax=Caenorhabditis brenneri TaxID=135651 RepID=G0NYE8_CAEBE|nr:hypothetical protein CAEBREN_32081 [Caenorhabditis brenneri]